MRKGLTLKTFKPEVEKEVAKIKGKLFFFLLEVFPYLQCGKPIQYCWD